MKPYLILALLILVTYANSLQNGFLWDDDTLIVNNPAINLSFKDMPSVFTDSMWRLAGLTESVSPYYRPVLSLYHMLNYKIWGLNPIGFHISNILLHLIITIILYKIGMILFNNETISIVAASIFAVHPINNEPVGRVACGEVIFGFFIILTLYLFLKGRLYLSLFTFILAVFSKEPAVMFPFALLILTIPRDGCKKGILSATPYILLAGVYLIIREMVMGEILGGVRLDVSGSARIFTMITVTMDYIRLLIIPCYISPFYPAKWHISVYEPKVIIAIIVLILISFLVFRIRKDRVMSFLLLLPLIMLAPVIWRVNRFPVGYEYAYLAERFLYVPLMLFSLFISAFIVRLACNNKRLLIMGWILFMAVFSTTTISSNMIWENNFTLSSRVAANSPDTVWAHNNMGNIYFAYNRFDEAVNEYLSAIRLAPNYAIGHHNLGNAYAVQDKLDEAIKEYLIAIRLEPRYAESHYSLGMVYILKGMKDSARKELEMALKINPNYQKAHQAIEELNKKVK